MDGKFHFVEDEKLYVRGVTYGTFRPENGSEYPSHDSVELDFRAMAAQGINALRTYTVPPRWMLDLAYESGLCVLVGLAWEQHVAFLVAAVFAVAAAAVSAVFLRTAASAPAHESEQAVGNPAAAEAC